MKKMSERILRWFGNRGSETVIEMTYRHLELTTEAVKQLHEMVRTSSDDQEKKKFYLAISIHEINADKIRREMITELSKRELYPEERDDLMELVRSVDWIADWAREAARIMVIVPIYKLPPEFKETIVQMCRENYSTIRILAKCIHALSSDSKKAMEYADQVELLEADLDDLYGTARNHFVELGDIGMTRGSLILLNEILKALETVSDWCENTADIARAIAIRVK